MTSLFTMLTTALLMINPVKLTPILELEPVSEDSDMFMQVPFDLTIGNDGRIYIADALAKTIFFWEKDGTFGGTIGKGGQGPGEFRFMSMGGPQAYLSVLGEELLANLSMISICSLSHQLLINDNHTLP